MLADLFESITKPHELNAMIQLKFNANVRKPNNKPIPELAKELSPRDFCYAVLHKVSRSFAVVIQQLTPELTDVICIFYLVLRGLDSVEDDMDFPTEKKIPCLREFYTYLELDGWTMEGVGDSVDYKHLLAHFDLVIEVYKSLKPEYRAVISDITKRMGEGMAMFAETIDTTKKSSAVTVDEYNEYCHYVAGLVGLGLSDLFVSSGLEDPQIAKETALSNNMGLFLQKTNIIRDYLEDLEETRTWWPQEIWGLYADDLEWFAQNPDHEKSRACLNHMITDAYTLIPDVLKYLSLIKNKTIFGFCAIPQVMAMGTLAKLYNNTDVFKRNVKIRKGITAYTMMNADNVPVVNELFHSFALDVQSRIVEDYNETDTKIAEKMRLLVEQALQLTTPQESDSSTYILPYVFAGAAVAAIGGISYISYKYK